MKREAVRFVPWVGTRSGQSQRRVCERLGLGWSRYQRWRRLPSEGSPQEPPRPPRPPHPDSPLPWETSATIDFALGHPEDGHRRLAWMMVDEDVAHLSESAVYRILSARDLLYRWARPKRHGAQRPPPTTAPHQRWHTDIMHLRLGDAWYFLVSFLDSYSRYIVHWELLPSMTADRVALAQLEALEKYPDAKPQIVSDRGCQYTSREYKQLIRRFELVHILCRVAHPQSNGLIERWHRSTREALEDNGAPDTHPTALRAIEAWVDKYNERRLHAGLHYIEPAEYFRGDPAARLTLRKKKLVQARENRRRANSARAEIIEQPGGSLQEHSQDRMEVSLSQEGSWSHLN